MTFQAGAIASTIGLDEKPWMTGADKVEARATQLKSKIESLPDASRILGKVGSDGGAAFSDNFFGGLKSSFRKSSVMGQSLKLLMGGGAIAGLGMAAHAIDSLTQSAEKFILELDRGNKSAGQMTDELVRAVPVLGSIWSAGQRIRSLLDGSALYVQRMTDATKIQDSVTGIMELRLKAVKTAAEETTKEIEKLRRAFAPEISGTAGEIQKFLQLRSDALGTAAGIGKGGAELVSAKAELTKTAEMARGIRTAFAPPDSLDFFDKFAKGMSGKTGMSEYLFHNPLEMLWKTWHGQDIVKPTPSDAAAGFEADNQVKLAGKHVEAIQKSAKTNADTLTMEANDLFISRMTDTIITDPAKGVASWLKSGLNRFTVGAPSGAHGAGAVDASVNDRRAGMLRDILDREFESGLLLLNTVEQEVERFKRQYPDAKPADVDRVRRAAQEGVDATAMENPGHASDGFAKAFGPGGYDAVKYQNDLNRMVSGGGDLARQQLEATREVAKNTAALPKWRSPNIYSQGDLP